MIHWTELVNILALIIVIYFAAKVARNTYNIIVLMIDDYKAKKEVRQNHCKVPHNYIKIYAYSYNKEVNVCTECGFSPDMDDYFPVDKVRAIQKEREEHQKYEDWKEKQIEDISMELNMGFDKTEILVNRILAFKRDYQVHFINEQSKGGDER